MIVLIMNTTKRLSELEKTKEKLTSLREEKFLVCEQAKEQADEKIEML